MYKIIKFTSISTAAILFALVLAAAPAGAKAWIFGIISDTQWTIKTPDNKNHLDDGKNPNTCAADIIRQVDQQFIRAGVDLVISVGDTVDMGSKINIDTRALYAQDLYNAGIGFYPLRGNHEAAEDPNYKDSGLEIQYAFPQTLTGLNNNTPTAIATDIIPAADLTNNPPAPISGSTFLVGTNFSFPATVNKANNSISYSFDYNNARFILLDQFDVSGSYYNSTIPDQQPWIDAQLSDTARPQQVFVFIHKNLLGGNHKDNMFGGPVNKSDPGDGWGIDIKTLDTAGQSALATKQQAEDKFITSLRDHNVRLFISGHDHMHKHSIVSSPLTQGKSVHQLITQSDSSKFYTPKPPFSSSDLPVAEDLYRIGYYIVSVDGPRATIDYYGSDATFPSAFSTTPPLNFIKLDSFGYSLNGKEFPVAEGQSYAGVQDTFKGTTACILGGSNNSTAKDNNNRGFTKTVETGWTSISDSGTMERSSGQKKPSQSNKIMKTDKPKNTERLASNILTLWGMADLGSDRTDNYTLSMTYDPERVPLKQLESGGFGIATEAPDGNWVNAVDKNIGGTKTFISGPWKDAYGLGTYGVDTQAHTAWAVINYNDDFAVANTIESMPGQWGQI